MPLKIVKEEEWMDEKRRCFLAGCFIGAWLGAALLVFLLYWMGL